MTNQGFAKGRGLLLLVLYNCTIIGAGHGVATIGIVLVAAALEPQALIFEESNPVFLLLGWPGMALLTFELIYASATQRPLHAIIVGVSTAMLAVSIGGLMLFSDVPLITLLTATPFLLASVAPWFKTSQP